MRYIILKSTPILRYTHFILRKNTQGSFTIMALNRNKFFVKYSENEDPIKISFLYGGGSKEKEFNFVRNKTENLETVLSRIRVKIMTAEETKRRKKSKKKTSPEKNTTENNLDLKINVSRSGKVLNGVTPNLEAWSNDTLVEIGDTQYNVVVNGPHVSELNLPKIIFSGYLIYPKLHLECANVEDSIFKWFHSISKDEKANFSEGQLHVDVKGTGWNEIGDSFFYWTSDKDFGRLLKLICIPKSGEICGKSEEVISSQNVILGPDSCPFEDRHEYTKVVAPSGSIRCVSYNILADLYADSETARNELFAHCPAQFLDFEYRKQLYLKEIVGYNSDILCLQEVDRKAFKHDLTPVLNHFGLAGVYNEKGGQVVEGLSCFYRSSKFRLIHSERILLCEFLPVSPVVKDIWDKISENEKLKERILARTTALQVVLLECTDIPNKQVLIGNMHLYFHPESDNIRLIQAATCIRYLEHVHQKYSEVNPSISRAVIICGDFNSCPEFGVYRLMTEGYLPEDSADWKSNAEETVSGIALRHNFNLGSGCGTPNYTNFTEGFYGCLDYIFYDKSKFDVKEMVPLPTHEQVTELVALPNKKFPSDHIAIICTLTWKDKNE